MSSTDKDHPKEEKLDGDAQEELKASDTRNDDHVPDSVTNGAHPMPSSDQQEETIKKKYGGLLPKKPPLISKDHERAFFDSADWALGKGKPKGPLEALRPKLQPTPHQQVRRSAYAPAGEGEEGDHVDTAMEDQSIDENNNNHNSAA